MNITKLLPVIGLAAGLVASAPALAGGPPRGATPKSSAVLSHNWTVGMNGQGSAAIIARVEQGLFFEPGHPENLVGVYASPQRFCMIAVQPENAALVVRLPNGKIWAATNDGEFAPDTSRGNCDTVAVAVPPGLAGPDPATTAPAPLPAAANGYGSAGNSGSNGVLVALGLAVAAFLSFAEYLYLSKSMTSEGRAAIFAIRRNKYIFDENTGEWQKITSRGLAGSTLVSTEPRTIRLVKEHKVLLETGWLTLGFNFGAFLMATSPSPSVDIGAPVYLGALVAWTFWAFYQMHKVLVIDPPAVQPDQKPFGEASPFSPPPAAGSDGMDYEMPV